jgi:glycosyltransferase involved in cell wall biosynthesis
MESLIRLEALAGFSVDIIALNTDKHHVAFPEVPETLSDKVTMTSPDLKVKPSIPSLISKWSKPESYFASRFDHHSVRKLIQERLKKTDYDAVVLDSLFMAVYLPLLKGVKVILRAHNIEHRIWQRQLELMKPGLKKNFIKRETDRLKLWENQVFSKVDGIWAISEEDQRYISAFNSKVEYLPCTFDHERQWSFSGAESPESYHIGAMDWAPNISGMKWFLNSVWPWIPKEQRPRLTILSKNFPQELKPLPKGVDWITERVEESWFDERGILVAPLLSGSGMRIKILEAMARGKAVLTTTIGAEGLGATHGKNIHIEDDDQLFAKALMRLSQDEKYRAQLSNAGRSLVIDRFADTSYLSGLAQNLREWLG